MDADIPNTRVETNTTAQFARLVAQAAAYTPQATGMLHTLRAVPSQSWIAFESRVPAPQELLEVAATCLRDYITAATIPKLHDLIAAARVEYARAEYHSTAFIRLLLPMIRRQHPDIDAHLARTESRGWASADVVTADPLRGLDSPACAYNDWLATFHSSKGDEANTYAEREPCALLEPVIPQRVLLGAIVVSWIDAALFKPARAMVLLANAMDLYGSVCALHGWDAAMDFAKDERKEAATKAGNASHDRHRELKQRAIDAYLAGTFASKNDAAFVLARDVVPLSVFTIREALKGVKGK